MPAVNSHFNAKFASAADTTRNVNGLGALTNGNQTNALQPLPPGTVPGKRLAVQIPSNTSVFQALAFTVYAAFILPALLSFGRFFGVSLPVWAFEVYGYLRGLRSVKALLLVALNIGIMGLLQHGTTTATYLQKASALEDSMRESLLWRYDTTATASTTASGSRSDEGKTKSLAQLERESQVRLNSYYRSHANDL